jgi:LuxR family maltose regulon positive regulatory protein
VIPPILKTKFYVPDIPQNFIMRPRLAAKIENGIKAGHKLALVAAPAGYGKTTAVAAWVRGDKRRAAWLSLDENDNETTNFWTFMTASIQSVLPNFGASILSALESSPPPPINNILLMILNDLSKLRAPLIMVLDDYHVIQNKEIHEGIAFLLDHHPKQFFLIITTRADPPLPIASLRAQQSLTELRVDDLRFTYEEAQVLLNEIMDLQLTSQDVRLLETRTEGWSAGLLLAALSLRGRQDKEGFIRSFSGSQHYVLEYLIEEVLNRQSEEIRNFLLQTAILGQFCGSLCDAVVGKENSTEIIRRLNRENLFIIPLDQERIWYRYHHLFADLLSNFLRKEFLKEDILEFHLRASQWYQNIGNIEKAIEFALGAEAYKRAAALIEKIFEKTIARGQVRTLLSWLEAIPEDVIKTLPHLHIRYAWTLSLTGQRKKAEQILVEIKSTLETRLDNPENLALYGEAAAHLTGIIMYCNDPPRIIHEAQEALAYLPGESLVSRARVFTALGTAYAYSSDLGLATQNFQKSRDIALKANNPFLAAIAIEMLAGMQIFHLGCLKDAAINLEQLLELGMTSGSDYQSFTGTAHVLLAEIHLEWNDLEKAEKLLDTGFRLIQTGGIQYSLTHANCTKARLMIARGNIKGAVEALHEADSATWASPLMHIMVHNLACQLRFAVCVGDVEKAEQWMEGDFAVLKYDLPEDLPAYLKEVRQIAFARVFLARGDVEKSLALLDGLYTQVRTAGRMRHEIDIYLLKAVAFHELGKSQEALEMFEKCLSLAEPEKMVRLFPETGQPVGDLLQMVMKKKVFAEYAGMLLSVMNDLQVEKQSGEGNLPLQEGLIDQLTAREMEVLRWMCEGYSNQKIAEMLVVSVNTIKKHTNNIYGKLCVKSRTQAVLQARKLNLI